jgi:hypothetical protein
VRIASAIIDLLAGQLGVPERRTLLAVPEHRTQQRVNVDHRPRLDPGQQTGDRHQVDQVSAQHRRQLQRVAVGELAQELPECRGRVHTGEQSLHPTRTDHVQVVDAVGATRHPGNDRRQLADRVHPSGLDLRRLRVDPHLLLDQLRQPGTLGQLQHRRQPGKRHEVVFVEHRRRTRPRIR